jgi:AcrR family transcriptional regulator
VERKVNNKSNVQHSAAPDQGDRIVTAARKRFQRFGYAKTSMQEIAAACGMSAANLYRFYPGKLAIAAAVAAADQRALLAACDEAVRTAPPNLPDQLIALFLANIEMTQRQIKLSPLLFELRLRVTREKREVRRQFLDEMESRVHAILASRQERGPAELDARETKSRLILMASAPFILPWMMLNEPFGNPRPKVAPLVHALISGLSDEDWPATMKPTPRFG